MRPLLAIAALAALLAPSVASQESADAGPLWYAHVTDAKARVRNLADPRGDELAAPAVGSLVAVYRERADWLEVEVPGGYAVWVFGKYLAETDQEGVFEVVRNGVNLRPEPKNDVTNFPLPQRLHANDRVLGIRRLDDGQPLDKTWVRVWSPRGVRAWIRASETERMKASEEGASLWKLAEQALFKTEARRAPEPMPKATVKTTPTVEAVAASADVAKRAGEELERGRRLMEGETPDLAASRLALEAAIRLAPRDRVAAEAKLELSRFAFLVEKERLRSDLEAERERLAEDVRQQQAEVREASRRKDPLRGIFAARGTLVRRIETDGTARFFVRWGGETTTEILCSTGRYSLDAFAGCEVGVHGTPQGGDDRSLPLIDIVRLEVIAPR